jgi:hypothetical protein
MSQNAPPRLTGRMWSTTRAGRTTPESRQETHNGDDWRTAKRNRCHLFDLYRGSYACGERPRDEFASFALMIQGRVGGFQLNVGITKDREIYTLIDTLLKRWGTKTFHCWT